MNYLKRAIATLLSLCMMFSILAQGPAVYAEYEPTAESTVQETTTEPEAPESAVPEEIPEESSPEQTDNIDSSLQESEAAAQDEPESSAKPAEETAEEAENMQQELAAPVEDIEESPREIPADTGAVEITVGDATEQDPCEPEPLSAITGVIDNDKGTTYTGRADGDAVIELDFRKTLAVTGIQYVVTGGTPIREYEIQITEDGSEWKTAAAGTFESGEANTVYFVNENNDPWVCTYDASRLRLFVKSPAGEEISVSEIDVLGPTGDNVELLENGIGILEKDYSYAEGESIPAGSLIFTGSYKGNPAYNVVLLYDEDGNIVGGVDAEGTLTAQQIILAPDPEDGQLGEVSEGYWVYWIEPDHLDRSALPETVRAELYRVDNALTNEGQRLTSDTLTVQMPEQLPQITIGGEN